MAIDIPSLIAFVITIAIWSAMFKDNVAFTFMEHTVVGLMTGYTAAQNIRTFFDSGINPVLAGKWIILPAVILGFLYYGRFSKKTLFLVRWPLALTAGLTSASAISGTVYAYIFQQVTESVNNLVLFDNPYLTMNNILTLICFVTSLIYFIFTIEHKGTYGKVATIGRWVLMITFGVNFAMLFGSRIAYLTDSIRFLFEFLGIMSRAIP